MDIKSSYGDYYHSNPLKRDEQNPPKVSKDINLQKAARNVGKLKGTRLIKSILPHPERKKNSTPPELVKEFIQSVQDYLSSDANKVKLRVQADGSLRVEKRGKFSSRRNMNKETQSFKTLINDFIDFSKVGSHEDRQDMLGRLNDLAENSAFQSAARKDSQLNALLSEAKEACEAKSPLIQEHYLSLLEDSLQEATKSMGKISAKEAEAKLDIIESLQFDKEFIQACGTGEEMTESMRSLFDAVTKEWGKVLTEALKKPKASSHAAPSRPQAKPKQRQINTFEASLIPKQRLFMGGRLKLIQRDGQDLHSMTRELESLRKKNPNAVQEWGRKKTNLTITELCACRAEVVAPPTLKSELTALIRQRLRESVDQMNPATAKEALAIVRTISDPAQQLQNRVLIDVSHVMGGELHFLIDLLEQRAIA